MTGPRHEHLARLMDHRRLELGMKWDEVAAAAGIKPPTLRAVRNGTNRPSALTQRGLEHALSWEIGSIEAILDGGTPTPTEGRRRRAPLRETQAIADANNERAQQLLANYEALDEHKQRMLEDLAQTLREATETRP